ncbi:VIT1/CCC1 transporter family protein [Candidatus Uhrbacteria bacterium]|nr:VIT1/CCC1 transporter family protein [Candidatus Uhrbacteria bacterium]
MEPHIISKKAIAFLRNLVFGVEDSLVSTVGLLSGIAVAGTSRDTIFLTGVVLIFVEAFSMGVGSFISEHAVESYASKESKSNADHSHTKLGGIVMFFSYFVAGFIPLFPYMVTEVKRAFPFSILISLLALFGLGILTGKLFRLNIWSRGWQMLILGGIAIALGIIVGKGVEVFLG